MAAGASLMDNFWIHFIVLFTLLTLAFLGMFFVLRVIVYETWRFARHESSAAFFCCHILLFVPPLIGFLLFLGHSFKYMIESLSIAYIQQMNQQGDGESEERASRVAFL